MIEAKYKTADGATKTSLLLTSGWCATLPAARALSCTALYWPRLVWHEQKRLLLLVVWIRHDELKWMVHPAIIVQVGRCKALPLPARDHGISVLERPGSSGLRTILLPMGVASLLT